MPLGKSSDNTDSIFTKKLGAKLSMTKDRPSALHIHNKTLENVYSAANVNPFSPNSKCLIQFKIFEK